MAKNDEAAKSEMKAARTALDAAHRQDRNSRRQSDECTAANSRVADAEENVSWWRR